MKFQWPATSKYTYLQTNRSDSLGSLYITEGADFQTDLDTFMISPRLLLNANTSDLANLGTPVAGTVWDECIWAIAGTRVFKTTGAPNGTWVEDTSTGAQTNYSASSDLAVFNGLLWATTDTGLYSKAGDGAGGGAWTLRDSSGWLSTADHVLTYFAPFNRLYYQPIAGTIRSIDSSNAVATTSFILTMQFGQVASCMVANSTSIWIGASSFSNVNQENQATIIQWDGISAAPTKYYYLNTTGAVQAMTVYKDVPYFIDGNGILNEYDGYFFSEVGRLPSYPPQPQQTVFVQRNGMIPTKNGTILAVVENHDAGNLTFNEAVPSGVWEWSSKYGFTHKYLVGYLKSGGSITDYGQNQIANWGCIWDVSEVKPFSSTRNGSIMVGVEYYTDASTTTNGLFYDDFNDTNQKKAYFVTTWFFTPEIQEKWIRLWAIFKRLIGATDYIVFKYRLYEEPPVVATITWTSTTTFTTTTDITAYAPTASGFNGTIGGEVEILRGTGGATCAHITSVVDNSGTYTATLDTVVVGVTSGTSIARFQKWIKLFPEVTGNVISYVQNNIGANNTRIQIKATFTITSDGEFNKLWLVSNSDITVTA